MKVKELIELLKTFPEDLPVVYQRWSEYCLMEAEDIVEATLCEARPDGWVQSFREDMPTTDYLIFPGN